MIYEVELEGPDGKLYIAELEGPEIKDLNKPKEEKPAIDVLGSAKKGLDAITKPTPSQMALGGLDPIQRFTNTALPDLYGQARGQLQGMVPQGVNRLLGTGIAGAVPGGVMLPSQTREEIGRQGVGLGIDVLAGTAANKAVNAVANIANKVSTAVNSVSSGKFRLPDFGGDKKLRDVAVQAKGALDKEYSVFTKRYDSIFSEYGDKPLSPESIKPVQDAALKALDDVPVGSSAEKYLGKFIERPESITAKELHNLKQEVYKKSKNFTPGERSALRSVYDAASDVLSSKNVLGDAYKKISNEYRDFAVNEAKYVEDYILDTFGKPTEEYLKKNHLPLNAKDAFSRLGKRAGLDLNNQIGDIRFGNLIKKYSLPALTGSGALGLTYKTLVRRGE